MKVAILVDGGFYRQRTQRIIGRQSPEERARELERYCYRHVNDRRYMERCSLYKIFYYDCPPLDGFFFHPIYKKYMDFSRNESNAWMRQYLDEFRKREKFVLRLGKLDDSNARFVIRGQVLDRLYHQNLSYESLTAEDFHFSVLQKEVDTRIATDICTLAYKKQVDRIVLISADSDFIPPAKLARREGLDFILDPLGSKIKHEFKEHVDGVHNCDSRFISS